VSRRGAGSLMKIVVRESMCQGFMCVHVSTLSQRRVSVSSLRPSACLHEDLLQLKRGRLRVSTRGSSFFYRVDERIKFKYEGAVNQ
jgi:hypothetical protein